MTTSELFINKIDCCGCEQCSDSCPKHLIEMREDEEGFLYPVVVNEKDCVHCNRCVNVCPMKSPGRQPLNINESYGGYVNELDEVKGCSSGGFATAISREFVKRGGVVYGVRYSDDYYSVEYSRADTVEELDKFRTSKYVQSRKGKVFSKIQQDLKQGMKVLFIGLPCECSALYHRISNPQNLYTISLICHGPTSQKVHRGFCEEINKSQDKITSFSVRHKEKGWKPYYISVDFANGNRYLKEFTKTHYEIAFKYLKRPSCSNCKYKLGNKDFGLVADMILGDYHAVDEKSSIYNAWGVSQASILSEKGKALMALILPICRWETIDDHRISTTNIALRAAIPASRKRDMFSKTFVAKGLAVACSIPSVWFEIKKKKVAKSTKRYLYVLLSSIIKRNK